MSTPQWCTGGIQHRRLPQQLLPSQPRDQQQQDHLPLRLLCSKQKAVNLNSPPTGFDRAVSVSQELTWNLPQGGQLVKQFLTQSLLGQMETHRTLVLFPQNIRVQNLQVSPAFILKPHLSCATLAMMHVIHCF